ncbi:hypothetical protein B296_00025304 [Ensete ventricosum]|uniref:Pentacotripeptide-repeat region of PRORP domain-containing protein n=1 Tax=Ensete ventricosum TaxID=4639 RepID=A0A426ZTQ5_ENSVE|nr:hypothetical protein B296_00025304 [Ensete ventricosum]
MALSKPLFLSHHLKSLKPYHPRPSFPLASHLRLFSFATPEEAAAERRRRKRRLRIEPPLSSLRQQQKPPSSSAPPRSPRTAPNPNAPKIPEPISALAGSRLNLHNRILTLIRENDLDEAALLVRHSIYSNCRPTIFTANAVLHALLRQSRYADLLSLHRFITQANVAPTVITVNLLLQTYCDCRKTDIALEHFRLLLKDDAPFPPSPTTYRILAKGLVDNGKLDQALELKDDMLAKAFVPPDSIVYNHLMQGFVKKGDPDKVVSLYEELLEKLGSGKILDGIVYGNLMKGYFGKGMEKGAMEIYRDVLGEGSKVRFGAVSYNLVLDALGRNGKLEEAIDLFDRMLKEHDPPRRITVNLGTFNVMVDAYCLAGRFPDAITVFRKMGEQKCIPDALSYNSLIEHLGSNKLVPEAEELYKEMGERGINPDEYTQEIKELVEEALRKEGREEEMGILYEDVEREKAERLAREAEEKARAEALAKEEEERKKREAAEKEAAAARASAAAIEAILGRKKDAANEESTAVGPSAPVSGIFSEEKNGSESSVQSETADSAANGEVLPEERNDSLDDEAKEGSGDADQQINIT